MVANEHLFTIARNMREAVADRAGVLGIDLPGTQFVAEGDIAIDCELLAVTMTGGFLGLPFVDSLIAPQRCNTPHTASYEVWLVRCAAEMNESGTPPTPEAQEASAETLMTDAWLLVDALKRAAENGDLSGACDDIRIGELTRYGPEGGYAGSHINVQVRMGNL